MEDPDEIASVATGCLIALILVLLGIAIIIAIDVLS